MTMKGTLQRDEHQTKPGEHRRRQGGQSGETLTTAGRAPATGEASGADDEGPLAERGDYHRGRRTLKPGDYQR
jgi:hypothetical protein